MLMVIALIIELFLKSSNVPSLVLVDLLVLVVIAFLQKEFSVLSLSLFILFSIVIELFNFKTIGIVSLSLFFSIFTVKALGNFIHFFSLDRRSIFSLILVYLFFLFFRLIIYSILKESITIELASVGGNIVFLIIFNWIISRIFNNKYVLER